VIEDEDTIDVLDEYGLMKVNRNVPVKKLH